jgi:plastocyanin
MALSRDPRRRTEMAVAEATVAHIHLRQIKGMAGPMVHALSLVAAAAMVIGIAGAAAAEDAQAPVLVIKDHVFQPAEVHVPIGKRITLTVDNQDATPEEFESHDLKIEKVVPGNSKGIIRFGPLDAGSFPFVGEFNEATAHGVVIAE